MDRDDAASGRELDDGVGMTAEACGIRGESGTLDR